MTKYRIGWESNGKWKYIVVNSHEEALEELADKTILSDKVSYRAIKERQNTENEVFDR